MNAYDEILYPSRTYAQTHPDRLATMATLAGLQPKPPGSARVLDIGCGDGLNILAMAAEMPHATFYGVDLAEVPIRMGQEWIRELGLENVQLEVADIGAPRDFGEFDYIIAHGVFSWVPEPVRHHLLALCRKALAPGGVAYISYNAYPGCHMRELSRRMMRYHVSHIDDPMKQIDQARSLFKMLVDQSEEKEKAYFRILEEQSEHSFGYNQAAFFHDDLSSINQPYYFHEFMELAENHGLQFLGEADLHSRFYGDPESKFNRLLHGLGEEDPITREQYLDFLSGRQFRQTLLCHAEATLDRELTPDKIAPLYISANLSPADPPDGSPEGTVVYAGSEKARITTSDPARKVALQALHQAWPQAIPFRQLVPESVPHAQRESLAKFIIRAAMSGMIEFRTDPPPLVAKPGPTPLASPFARWESKRTNAVTSLLHKRVKLEDPSALAILDLLDGSRTRQQLPHDLATKLLDEFQSVKIDGQSVSTPDELIPILKAKLPPHLQEIAKLGLLKA